MQGLGFLIWKLEDMPEPDVLTPMLVVLGVKWVSIKVADGVYSFNQIGGNDKKLLEYFDAFEAAGIERSGWHYLYDTSPGPQGDKAEERFEKLHLKSYLLDAEGGWNQPWGMGNVARTLCDKLHNGVLEVTLCAARFPSYFPNYPFAQFMKHEKVDGSSCMMYWQEAHNPKEQLLRSLGEYQAITNKPYMPIGSTYGVKNKDGSLKWEPTVDDLKEFVQACKDLKLKAYGFYSLDWIINHNRTDWLEAIAGAPTPPPPPPPPTSDILTIVNCSYLNGRSTPDYDPNNPTSNKLVTIKAGLQVESLNEVQGNWMHVKVGLFNCWMHRDYLQGG